MFLLPPELAHNIAVFVLSNDWLPYNQKFTDRKLETEIAGLKFRNPVGMAAGFDKNAECISGLMHQNFGFVEVGTVTPIPQKGNQKPRMFRFIKDEAVINRLGFNNKGIEIFSQKLRQWKYSKLGVNELIVGANIGKNKQSPNDASDYLKCFERVCGLCDYVTINISSPNTPGLRDIQKKETLELLVKQLSDRRNELANKLAITTPLFLKISPDETDEALSDIAEIALSGKIEGVILSNTTVNKDHISEGFAEKHSQGGLSGKPLLDRSTLALRKFYKLTGGKVPLIGVGGISSAEDAYAKIRAGASLVQIYTALIYKGFSLVNQINKGLVQLLEKDGFMSIKEAVGADVK